MKDFSLITTNNSGAFPAVLAINSTGPATTDGTEFVAPVINETWGMMQAFLDLGGLTPDASTEAAGTSQVIESLRKGFGLGAGYAKPHFKVNTTGDRVLTLNGQGILVSSYLDLVTACYVGDGNNAAVGAGGGAFYKADDAAGVTPNTAGIYFILPETRGYTPRGLDLAASVDPDGAGRFLGDNQVDAAPNITGQVTWQLNASNTVPLFGGETGAFNLTGAAIHSYPTTIASSINLADQLNINASSSSAKYGASTEVRMTNFSTQWVITY